MKKFRLALILLLAMLVSVALFACGGKKPDDGEESETKVIRSVGLTDASGKEVKTMDFTDADGETEWQAALNALSVTVVYRTNASAKLTMSDCTVSGTIDWGTVGNYSVTVTPKENNSSNYSATLSVVIDHDFHLKEGSEDTWICSVDRATKVEKELNATIKWKGFHVDGNYYDFEDETGSIRDFGTIQTAAGEQQVRTTTVGRLEKGMTITLTGTAQNADNRDEAYYFPILGFADTAYNGPFTSYTGGTAIFVRNEGWVLQNGVGAPRLLAGLVGGSDDSTNYGSHPSDEGWKPDGYDSDTNGYGPSNYEDWVEWHVYSHGTICRSEDYVSVQNVKFSWSYYDIDQEGYGLIVVTFYILNNSGDITSSLVCSCKVPDSDNGYYDSILHGEYCNMTFSKIETVQTRTITNIYYNGLRDGAKTHYLENELLDFKSLNVTAEYEQKPGAPEPDTQFDVQAKVTVGSEEKWISLRYTPLTMEMKEFKIVRTVGNDTKEAPITGEFITIFKNAVDVVYGYQFDGYKVNDTLGEIPVVSVTEGDETYVSLTLANSVAANSYGTDKKFVSFRLYARSGATQFFTSDSAQVVSVKAGETVLTANDDYIVTFADGSYVDVIIFVKGNANAAAILKDGVTIDGLVDGGVNVKVDLSAINGTDSVSEVISNETVYLEQESKVTIKYHIADAYWIEDNLSGATINVNGNGAFLGSDFLDDGFKDTLGGVKVSATANAADKTITVEYTIPKITVTNVLSYKLQLDMLDEDWNTVTQAIDTVYYDLTTHGENEVGVYDSNIGAYLEANGAKLYIIQVFKNTNLSESLITSGGSLKLSINAGTKESVNYLDLAYTYENGAFVFSNSTASGIAKGTLTAFGSVGNDYDYDYGAVAVLEVDLSKLPTLGLNAEGAYYFELNGTENPAYIYKVENGALTKVNNPVLGDNTLLTEDGTCLSTGYAGKAYQVNGETVFYAAVAPTRGNHEVHEGVCTICGATVKEGTPPTTWFENSEYVVNGMVAEGSFLEFMGTFSEDETEALGTSKDTYNGISIVIAASGPVNYVLGGDGFLSKRSGGTYGWDVSTDPVADTSNWSDSSKWDNTGKATELTNSLITEEHPNNTINGWVNANGEAIDAETYNTGRIGATYRYTLTREKDSNVLVARFRIWKQGVDIITGVPFVDFTYTLELESYTSIAIMGSTAGKYLENTTLTVISGKMDNLIHEHDWDEYAHCKVDGCEAVRIHEHNYVNGVCTICSKICEHEHAVENVCPDCGAVYGLKSEQTVEGVSATSTTWNSAMYTGFVVNQGEIGTISGTMSRSKTSDSIADNNYDAICFEFTQGLTMRSDAYCWNFDGADGNAWLTSSGVAKMTNADGTPVTTDWVKWASSISLDATWVITVDFTGTAPVVTAAFTANSGDYAGWTMTSTYACTWAASATDKSTVKLQLGPCGGDYEVTASVTATTISGWTWNND